MHSPANVGRTFRELRAPSGLLPVPVVATKLASLYNADMCGDLKSSLFVGISRYVYSVYSVCIYMSICIYVYSVDSFTECLDGSTVLYFDVLLE